MPDSAAGIQPAADFTELERSYEIHRDLVGIVGDIVFIKHVNIIIDRITGQTKAHEAKEKYADVEEAEIKED